VGVAFDCVTPGGHAWLWENGGPIVDLNTLVPPGSNLTLEFAQNINDRGEIAGIGSPPGCNDPFVCGHTFVLIPCDGDHPDTEGCKDGEATADVSQNSFPPVNPHLPKVAQTSAATVEMIARIRARTARRFQVPGLAIGPTH